MTFDPTTARDDADKAIRAAIEALAGLGNLERLHPVDRIAVGQAAAQFADVVTAAARRANAARRGKRGTRRTRAHIPTSTHNPNGDAA